MKISKRLSALLLTLCMLLSLLPTTAFAVSTEDFSDFPPASHWAHEALEAAVQNGLMNGDGNRLNPADNLSRAEMAAVINRAFGATEKADISSFTDVAKGKWYYDDISKAVAMGTFQGDGGGIMRPEADITRQEAFLVLARAFELSGADASALDKFSDKADVASWASDALASMAAAGYINGSGGRLNPLANITRQEFAQVMFNVLKTYVRIAGTVTKVAVGNVMVSAAGATLKDMTIDGDLILGEGADNTVLDNVKVTGRIVVRGGGKNALALTNGSQIQGNIIVIADGAGISADKDSSFIHVNVKADDVAVSGSSGTVAAGAGVSGVTVNGDALQAGNSTEIKASSPGSGGGGGGTPPTPTVATTSLTITPPSGAMTVGAGRSALTVSRNSGANDSLSWESANEAVVRIDHASGRLSAVGVGEAVISAESASGVVGSTTVYVVNPSGTALTDYTITEPGTVLENCSFAKLTIAASVGVGEVTLRNVTANELVVLGGGSNSVTLSGGSYGEVNVNSTLPEQPRILAAGDVVVGEVTVGASSTGAIIETQTGSAASIGSLTAGAPATVRNSEIPTISTSADLELNNATVGSVTTTGTSSNVDLNGATVNSLTAGAVNTTITGDSSLPLVNANGNVNTSVPVGTVAASGNANVTASASVSGVTGTAGSVSLTNSGSTAVTAKAGSVSVSGDSKPTVSGEVATVTVNANDKGSSGVTVTGSTSTINTTGTGTVGEISIGGAATPTVNANVPVGTVSVSDTAAPTITGTATTIVSSSSNTVNASGASTENVLASGGSTVQSQTQTQTVTTELQYIAVTALPVKTEYAVGSALDTAGLVVTGYYTVSGFDGTISKAVAGYTTGNWESSAGTHEITVTHEGKTAKFNVKVVAQTVASISIKATPTTKAYDLSNGAQTLNIDGGSITVNYTSSLYPAETINITSAMCSSVDLTTIGAKTVTVTYGDKAAAFTVNVINSAADAFALAKSNAKAEFLAYVSDKLINNTYSETGKAAIKNARDAGIAAIEALSYTSTALASTLTTEKGKVDAILTQDGEWTQDANAYKSACSAILTKTASTVAISDKAAVSAALSAYNGLASGVQAKLTTEKALLDSLLAKIAQLEAAQTLDAAKSSAKSTLTSALADYSSGYTTNKAAIESAKTAGDTAIDAAATVADVTAALDTALANMASFKSDAQLLTDAKVAAINSINAYLPNSIAQAAYDAAYNTTGKAQVAELHSAGVQAINAAATTNAVTSALSTAKSSIDSVQTAAQMTAAALASAKTAAKAELNAYGNAEDYRAAQKAELTGARSTGSTSIDSAADTAAVTAALKSAKAAIDAIKTNAQLTAAELATAKTNGKTELSAYYPTGKTADSYSATGKAIISTMRTNGSAAIDAAVDATAVAAALAAAKTNIDGVKDISGENTDAVTAAKSAAEAATYAAAAQASYPTEASLADYVKGIAETAVGTGITVSVTRTAFTAPTAGTLADPDGTPGSYSFTLTLTKGGASATTKTLSVIVTATTYTAHPAVAVTTTSASVEYMGGATLTATASDILSPTYQWYKGSTAIEGKTTATLTLTNLTATATYYCMCGETKSNEVTVTVAAQGTSATPEVTITGMAASYTLPHSQIITLSVGASDTYTYLWQSKTGSGDWTQAATTASLTVSNITIGMNGTQYRCTVTNTETNKLPASATSAVVTLNIVKGTQNAPSGLAQVQTSFGADDGKITGVTAAMEYKLSTAAAYTACTGTEITGLAVGTYHVRYAETDVYNASADASVTVTEGAVGAKLIVNGVGYADLAEALSAAGTAQAVQVADNYTIAAGTTVTVVAGQTVTVAETKALTVTGALINSGTVTGAGVVNGSGVLTNNGKMVVKTDKSLMTQYTGGGTITIPDHAGFATAENGNVGVQPGTGGTLTYAWDANANVLTISAPGDQKIAVATNPASYGGNAAHWIGFRLTVPAGATHLSQRQWNQYADVSCTGTGSNIEERTNDTNSWDFGVGTWGFYQRAENSLNKTWLYKTAYKFADNEYYFEVFKLVCSFGEDDLDTLLKATIGNGTLFARTYTVGENLALASSATVTVADTGTLVVPEGKTLTIPNGAKLVINGTLTVNGTLVNNGTLSGTGTVNTANAITGNGTVENTLTVNQTKSLIVNGVGYADLAEALSAAAALTQETVGTGADAVTYTPYQPVEVVGDYTIANGTTIQVAQGHSVVVKSGGSLTNNGTLQFHKSSMNYAMFDSGELCVEQGGSYTVGSAMLIGGKDAVFNLLTADTENSVTAGEIWITGAPLDAAATAYDKPFLFLNGNIEVPAGKACTISADDYMTFIANGALSVSGSLTSTAFNEIRENITVKSTGSLTLNNTSQSESGPNYFTGDKSVPHSMGGTVFVVNGGSYTVGTDKLIGTSDAKLNMTSGDAMVCGQPADGGENLFVFVFGEAAAGASDWQKFHFIVDTAASLTIPQGVTVTLGSNEIRGTLINNGTLTATNGLGVNGSVTNGGVIENKGTLNLFPGASLNNTGTINGVWRSNNNPDDENDGRWDTAVVLEYGTTSATLTNSGTINDHVTVCCYVGAEQSNDKIPAVTITGSGTIARRYDVAVVESTAALKHAITDTGYDEYHTVGAFELTESVTIPNGHLLYSPDSWFDGTSNVNCSFTVASGVTLTNNGGVELWGNTTVNGGIVNNDGESIRLIVGSNGETGSSFTLVGTLANNGYMELRGENGKGAFTIASGGTLTNSGHMNIHGFLLTNSGSLVNSGSADVEYGYTVAGALEVGFTGTAPTGSGAWNGMAFVANGAALSAAAERSDLRNIWVVPAEDYKPQEDVEAKRTITLTNDVTIKSGVSLTIGVAAKFDESGERTATYPIVLVVPNGKTLTISGSLFISGELQNTGTLSLSGSAEIEARHSAQQIMGKLTSTGTVTVSAGGSIDCRGGIDTTGTFTNSGSITTYVGDGGYPMYGTVTGTITDNQPVSAGAMAGTEAALRAALADESVSKVTVTKSIALTADMAITKPVTIAEGWENDLPAVILTVPTGKTLTVSADMEVLGGLVGEYGSITIAAGNTVTVSGRMGYISSAAASAKLTVNGTLALQNGAGLVLGSNPTNTATAAGSVINNGAIEVINGWIDFVSSNEATVLSGDSRAINYYANRAALARELVNRLAVYPNMAEPAEADYNAYGIAYSDWGELYGNDENPDNDDNDAAHGFAWLLKNGIITGADGRIYPYGELPASDAKAVFTALAIKILGSGYTNEAMTNFLGGLSDTGHISTTNIHVTEGDYDTNALNQLIDGFIEALNLSSVNVSNESELTAALAKNYVTDIHITASMSILGAKENESDTNNSCYLRRIDNADRRVHIDTGATLTVGDGSTSTKLDVESGVELIISQSESSSAHLTIKSGSGMNVFGGLKPDNWGEAGMNLVTQEENTYINFFPDVMEFGQRLADKVGTRLTAPTQEEINGYAQTENTGNWPGGDERSGAYAFLIKYAGETHKADGNGYFYWDAYRKLEYGNAMAMLLKVYQAIVTDATALPDTVKLDWYSDPTWLVNDGDLNVLLEKFAACLPALPKTEDTAASFTVDGTTQVFTNTKYTSAVTISYSGTPDAYGWGGDVRFENCEFVQGVTVTYSDTAPFAVDFGDSCTVTDGVSVAPGSSTTLWKNNNVEIRGANGLTVTATAPTHVSSGSGNSFALNGVTVTGTFGDTQNENWYSASIRYNCDGQHDNSFDWSNGGNHSSCKMADGTTDATVSRELQLNTGTDGSITATTTQALDMNVRVEGNADISGLTVAEGKEITVSDNQRHASVNLGANTVQVYDNANNGYSFTGTTGAAVIHNQGMDNASSVTLGTVDLGAPHVFGDAVSGYQIFVGYPAGGDTGNVTFTVEQGEDTLTHAVDTQYLATDSKLHLTKSGENAWITDPGNVRLTVAIGGVSVTYEPLAFKAPEVPENAVASISSNYYETLEAAVSAANAGDTITLLKDSSGSGIGTFANTQNGALIGVKDFTIDFGGFTYTCSGPAVGSSGTQSQAFHLEKGASVTLKNGTINTSGASGVKMLVQNYCNLTLEDITLDGTNLNDTTSYYTLSNNCGTVNIIGATNIIAHEGGNAFDLYYWPGNGYTEGVNVTVNTTGTITGNIEYGSDNSTGAAAAMYDKAQLRIESGSFVGSFSTYSCNDHANIVITGGTFSSDPTGYLAEGHIATQNEGVWTVAETTP